MRKGLGNGIEESWYPFLKKRKCEDLCKPQRNKADESHDEVMRKSGEGVTEVRGENFSATV